MRVLRVDPVAGRLSLSLKPSDVVGAGGRGSSDGEDAGMADGSGDEEGDLDEEMAAHLEAMQASDDDEVRARKGAFISLGTATIGLSNKRSDGRVVAHLASTRRHLMHLVMARRI